MKCIRFILVAVLLFEATCTPCLADEAVVLKGDQIDRRMLKVGLFAEVTYVSEDGKQETASGFIRTVKEDAFTVMDQRPRTVRYRNIVTLTTGRRDDVHRTEAAGAVAPGARIRVKAVSVSGRALTGTLVAISADSLLLSPKPGDRLAIPLASLTELKVNLGRKWRVREGALVGFLLGGTGGAVWGYCSGGFGVWEPDPGFRTEAFLGSGLAGALVGALVCSVEKWQEVALNRVRVGISPADNGAVRLSASFPF